MVKIGGNGVSLQPPCRFCQARGEAGRSFEALDPRVGGPSISGIRGDRIPVTKGGQLSAAVTIVKLVIPKLPLRGSLLLL